MRKHSNAVYRKWAGTGSKIIASYAIHVQSDFIYVELWSWEIRICV